MAEFKVNLKRKDAMIGQQKRQSDLWKKQAPIRICFWLCIPVSIWLIYHYLLADLFFASMLVMLVWCCIYISYYAISSRYAVLDIRKTAEELELGEQELIYLYHPFSAENRFAREETRIKYAEIKRIEYHPYYQNLKVFAPIHYTIYRDCRSMSVSRDGTLQEGGDFRLYYEYFEGFSDFVKGLSEKSGIPVTRIDTKENFEKERKLK